MELQYRIIAERAGWARRPAGLMAFAGRDRLSFLHALVSADVAALEVGHGRYAAWLTPQGRMVTDLEILNRGDLVLAVVPGALAGTLVARLDAMIFTEDVAVTNATDERRAIDIVGATASHAVAEVCGCDLEALDALAELDQLETDPAIVYRRGDAPLPMFRLLVAASASDGLAARLSSLGVDELSDDLLDALRIEAGRPAWGADLLDDTIPLEAGLLDRAISTTKGCYVGQEVIIRVLHRGGGRVARRLVKLVFDERVTEIPPAGTSLWAGDDTVGKITSRAYSPLSRCIVALGYVRRDVADTSATVSLENGAHAAIAGLAG